MIQILVCFLCLSVSYFIHLSSFIRPFVISLTHSYIHSLTYMYSFIHSFIHSFICLLVRPFTHSFLCSFVYSFFTCSFIHSFIHLFVRSFIHIHLLVHSFKHSKEQPRDTNLCLKLHTLLIVSGKTVNKEPRAILVLPHSISQQLNGYFLWRYTHKMRLNNIKHLLH